MARFLLDTDAVIDLIAGIRPTSELILGLSDAGNRLCTCSLVVAEVHAGLLSKDELKGRNFLESCEFLPANRSASRQAGRWRFSYARMGQKLALPDSLIAATAVQHDAIVITGNVTHFPMPEVTLLALPREGRKT